MNTRNVEFQTFVLRETGPANGAQVGSFSLMNSVNVLFQMVLIGTAVFTYVTCMWFLSLMNCLNVASQHMWMCVTITTYGTHTGPFSIMSQVNVVFQFVFLIETRTTLRTDVRFVYFCQMRSQDFGFGEFHAANITNLRRFSLMNHANVISHIRLFGKGFTANVTLQISFSQM